MISVGSIAPEFALRTQFGSVFALSSLRGKSNVLLLFYPADWTPTCATEVPELDRLADRFANEAHTQVVAISTDSHHSHANWAASCGGISIPILADFAPKGDVSKRYGVWLGADQTSDRATVLVDARGMVRYANSVGRDGHRNAAAMLALLEEAKRVDQGERTQVPYQVRDDLEGELFVSTGCAHCRTAIALALDARAPRLRIRYRESDPSFHADLARSGASGLPFMKTNHGAFVGSTPIARALAERYEKKPR